MKLTILAVGRLARSPEVELVKLYVDRATAAGRALGLGPVEVVEVESKKPGKAAEAEVLRPHLADAHVIACDERGTARASRDFAAEIAKLRDQGVRRLVFLIGGGRWPGSRPGRVGERKARLRAADLAPCARPRHAGRTGLSGGHHPGRRPLSP